MFALFVGIAVDSGKPSTLQMLKLAANAKFREASKKVVEEFQNVGVDLRSKVRSFVGLSPSEPLIPPPRM
jgi:hypothetical protein